MVILVYRENELLGTASMREDGTVTLYVQPHVRGEALACQ